MKKLLVLMLLFASGVQAWCMQSDTAKKADTSRGNFFGKLHLRQSFQATEKQQDPAVIQLTIPSVGKANWLIDAGLSLAVNEWSKGALTTSLTGEFHRNTIIDEQQYNYQAGFNFNWFYGKSDGHTTIVWNDNIKYIRDVTDSANSIAATINLSLYRAGNSGMRIGKPVYIDEGKHTYQFGPYAEIQYQQFFASGTKISGAIIRPMINLSASYAWNRKLKKDSITVEKEINGVKHVFKARKVEQPSKLFELTCDYVNRYAVVNNTGNDENYTKLFKAGINYYIFSTSNTSISLGISYNLGSDPLNGLKDQRFTQIALQVKL